MAKRPPKSNEITAAEFAERLRAAFEAKDLGRSEAAHELGWSPGRITEYLNGERMPSIARVIRMVDGLGLDGKIIAPEFFGPKSRKSARKKNPQKRREGG